MQARHILQPVKVIHDARGRLHAVGVRAVDHGDCRFVSGGVVGGGGEPGVDERWGDGGHAFFFGECDAGVHGGAVGEGCVDEDVGGDEFVEAVWVADREGDNSGTAEADADDCMGFLDLQRVHEELNVLGHDVKVQGLIDSFVTISASVCNRRQSQFLGSDKSRG